MDIFPKGIKIIYNWKLMSRKHYGFVLYPFIFFRLPKEEVVSYMYKHELHHVHQIREMGVLRFYWEYLIQTLKYGYICNKFEVEARLAQAVALTEEELEIINEAT